MIRVIYNPVAGPKMVRKIGSVREILSTGKTPFEIRETAGPGDAVLLAREAAHAGMEGAIAVGGGGTFGVHPPRGSTPRGWNGWAPGEGTTAASGRISWRGRCISSGNNQASGWNCRERSGWRSRPLLYAGGKSTAAGGSWRLPGTSRGTRSRGAPSAGSGGLCALGSAG